MPGFYQAELGLKAVARSVQRDQRIFSELAHVPKNGNWFSDKDMRPLR